MSQENEQNFITSSGERSTQIDIQLKVIEQNACKELLNNVYDDATIAGKLEWLNRSGSFLLGTGLAGIINWIATTEKIPEKTIEELWKANIVFFLFSLIGLIMVLIYCIIKYRRKRKKKLIDKYMQVSDWNEISNNLSLMIRNVDMGTQRKIDL